MRRVLVVPGHFPINPTDPTNLTFGGERMPVRTDIKKILIIGGGPVAIGQANEFDGFGYQAARTLRELGYQVVCVNSSPAAAMTDPKLSESTYIEPLELDSLTGIIRKERPDALLSTHGGQTALSLVTFLEQKGVLDHYGVEVIGASDAIAACEAPQTFADAMKAAGIATPRQGVASSLEDGVRIVKEWDCPPYCRAAYATGGAGSAIAYNMEEFVLMLSAALDSSPIRQVAIQEPALRRKQITIELLRDSNGNCVTLTAAECIDPIGVHPGDSAVVIPPQTLPDQVVAKLSEIAHAAANAVGICGSGSVRFAVEAGGDPESPQWGSPICIACESAALSGAGLSSGVGYLLTSVYPALSRDWRWPGRRWASP